MKKIVLLFGIIILLQQSVFAYNEMSYCAQEPYNLSRGIGSFFSSVTGTNFLVTQVVKKEIAKSMKKDFGGKFDVKIDTFGGSNLQNGKFKKLTITGKDLDKNGISMTDFKAETMCGFNQVGYKNGKLSFEENMVVKYQGKLTAADLKNIVNSEEYKKSINKLSVSAGKIVLFKVANPDADIRDNRINMSYDVLSPALTGTKTKRMAFSAGLDVEDGKISFTDVNYGRSFSNMALKTAEAVINLVNPLGNNVLSEKNHNAIVNVKNVKIYNNEILTDGTVIFPKTKK